MKRLNVSGIIILLVISLLISGCGQASPQGKTQEFQKITASLSLIQDDEYGTIIPYGSVIYHWANGITEVYGPDNTRILIAKDSEAAQLRTPAGWTEPATLGLGVPSGTNCVTSDDGNITWFFLGDTLIGTKMYKSENFPVEKID
jgi:hypothetical protein